MKPAIIKLIFTFVCGVFCLPLSSFSQNLTGIWRGYFQTDDGEHYKLEFQVTQKKTSSVTGVSYSYLDTRFYGKATMTGFVKLKEKKFQIQEIKTVEVKNLGGGGTCVMNYSLTYSKSGNEEFLEGTYLGKTEDRKNPKNNGKWGDCGGGTVFLRRVQTSDFYVEPFLRKNTPPAKTDTATKKPATPLQKKPVVTTKKPVTKPPVVQKPTTKPQTTITTVKNDTVKKGNPIVIDKPKERPKFTPPAVTRSRENELVKTFTVSDDEITVKFFDNGEIDDDTISVYLDSKPIVSNQRLSTAPITIKIKMDDDNPEHTLVMVAENLGRIPPNTSLMTVQDGNNRYQASITSTEQKNAMVRFRYQKKGG